MSEVMEYAARLSDVIGVRPAGTEEEQQASFFIEEVMANKASLETSVEEFNCNPNYELPRIICCIVSVVLAILSIPLGLIVVPAFVITLIMAAFYILEVIGLSPLNNVSKRGISQNVIGRYIPSLHEANNGSLVGNSNGSASSSRRASARKRKIVLIAHYDSGKICRELQKPFFGMLNIIKWAEIAGIALIPLVLLIRIITDAAETLLVALNVFMVIGAVLTFIPILVYILHQTAPYSEGANNNASGVAVMLEVARRISERVDFGISADLLPESSVAESPIDPSSDGAVSDDVVMHGEETLRASGLLPEDAELSYAAGQSGLADSGNGNLQSENMLHEGGVPVSEGFSNSEASTDMGAGIISDEGSYGRDGGLVKESQAATYAQPVGSVVVGGNLPNMPEGRIAEQGSMAQQVQLSSHSNLQQENVPDWFKKGIAAANAKKEVQYQDANTPIQRSRFADEENPESDKDIRQSAIPGALRNAASDDGLTATRMSQASIEAAAGAMLLDGSIKTVESAANSAALTRYDENTTIEDAMRSADIGASSAEAIGSGMANNAGTDMGSSANANASRNADAGAGVDPNASAFPAERTSVTGKSLPSWPPASANARDRAVQEAAASLKSDVALAKEKADLAEAKAAAQAAEEIEEQAAILDRTISYIPVVADIPDDTATDAVLSSKPEDAGSAETAGKTPEEILAAATHLAEEGSLVAEVEESIAKEEAKNRKKRSIDLPSLTGAIAAMSEQKQSAPLADLDQKGDGHKRSRRLKATSLPSPTDAVVKSVRSKATRKDASPADQTVTVLETDDSITSIKPSDAKEDAAKALSTLDSAPDKGSKTSQESKRTSDAAGPRASKAASKSKNARQRSDVKAANALPVISASNVKAPTVNVAGSFGVGSQTGSFAPVGEELIADMVEDDIIIQDVDDSAYQQNTTSTGAYAGPGYVNMPKSRADRIKGIFGRKKSNHETSLSEAIGIDKTYDARKIGTERGSWESFKDESANYNPAKASRHSHVDHYSTNSRSLKFEEESWDDGAWEEDSWNGGAFSLNRKGDSKKSSGRNSSGVQRRKAPGNMLSELAAETADEVNSSEFAFAAASGQIGRRRAGDGSVGWGSSMSADGALASGAPSMDDIIAEREQIRSLRASAAPLTSFSDVAAFASSLSSVNEEAVEESGEDEEAPKGLQTEVWFVALGAELADNAGIKAFLSDHADELRGSIVIELDAMGAGTPSLIETEGAIKHKKISARMKRYAIKAASALGIKLESAKMDWRDSAAYFAANRGLQTIHVAGLTDGKPTYLGEADDTYENINEESLMEGAAFTLELIHSI